MPPSSSSSTNFQLVINNALEKYKKRTKKDLIKHPLAAQIQSCDSPSAILPVQFLPYFNSKFRSLISPGVAMNGGQNGLILPLTSSTFYLRLLRRVLVWSFLPRV